MPVWQLANWAAGSPIRAPDLGVNELAKFPCQPSAKRPNAICKSLISKVSSATDGAAMGFFSLHFPVRQGNFVGVSSWSKPLGAKPLGRSGDLV